MLLLSIGVYELRLDSEIDLEIVNGLPMLAREPHQMRQVGFDGKREQRCNLYKLRARANDKNTSPHSQLFLYSSAVICSEIRPIRNTITAALNINMLMFVNRWLEKYV